MAEASEKLLKFEDLLRKAALLFSKVNKSRQPTRDIMEAFAALPAFSQLLQAAKQIEFDKELSSIIDDAISILSETINDLFDFQPSLKDIENA